MIEERHCHPSRKSKGLAKRSVEVLRLLLEHGASPDEALLYAIVHNHTDIVKVLIGGEVNPNYVGVVRDAIHSGHTVGTNCGGMCYLGAAAFQLDLPIIKRLLQEGANINYVQTAGDDKGCNVVLLALQSALEAGFSEEEKDETKVLKVIKFLLGKGELDLDQARDKNGETALILAIRSGFYRVAKLLLESGADPNVQMVGSIAGRVGQGEQAQNGASAMLTALTYSAGTAQVKMVRLLLDHNADVNLVSSIMRRSQWMMSPVHEIPLKSALYENASELVIEAMIKAGAVLTHPEHDQKLTAMVAQMPPVIARCLSTYGNPEILGDGVIGKRLWLSCMLKAVVGITSVKYEITVRRDDILGGLCEKFGIDEITGEFDPQFARAAHLSVKFEGENSEGDGLRREWLRSATAEICDLRRGLFESKDGGRTSQPNPGSEKAAGKTHLSSFAQLARIVGFALFHSETIPAQWSGHFIKAAFGYEIVAADLEAVDPELYRNHVQLIENYDAAEHDGMSIGAYWRDSLMVGDLVFATDQP